MSVYVINGKEYDVKTGREIHDINSSWPDQQFITINGVMINLHTLKSDEYNKRSLGLEVISERSSLSIPEIYEVISYRIAKKEATNLEKAIIFQLKYHELAKAEAKAQGEIGRGTAETSILTERQILGLEKLPNLKNIFPWAYASTLEIEADKKRKDTWLIGANAAFREDCRENLQEIQKNRWKDYFEDHTVNQTGLLSDLSMQATVSAAERKFALNKLENNQNEDKNSQLVAQDTKIPLTSIKDNGKSRV